MIQQLGDFQANSTVRMMWNTNAADGSSITRATNGSIRIYKGDSTTERSSSNGITDTEDFDSLTGVHHLKIDLSDNTDASFYAAGNDYFIVLQGASIDGLTVNACLAQFSIINRAAGVNVVRWNSTAVPTEDTAGYPKVTVKDGTGTGEIDTASGRVQITEAQIDQIVDELLDEVNTSGAHNVTDSVGQQLRNTSTGSTIADAVWDELRSGHVISGSFGEGVLIAASGIASTAFVAGAINAAAVAADAIGASELASDAANEIADALLDRTSGIETGYTLRQSMRLILAACAGKLSGAGTTTVTIRDATDSANRITATVDSVGNRSAVTHVVT